MSFELLPQMTYWFIGFVVVTAAALAVGLTALVRTLADYREDRLARNESIPTYYRRLSFGL
ncbi:hypothetical protein [Nocardioides sambongensis]|uniref:hypothetical protein n=1 Tax=Nocardioides sambongensis TaxID=2589074 RepID=UPI0015E8605C|nr:hypothetical protein [Nocardioides sambongensis]